MHAEMDRERRRGVARLRFSPALEGSFRSALRKRLMLPRALLFIVIAIGFGTAPLYNRELMHASESVLPLLLMLEVICTLAMLAAATVTVFSFPRLITQAIQLSSVVIVMSAILLLRYLTLSGDMQYPAQMTGVVLIAAAFFGGFTWRRIALGTVVFSGLAIALEFWKQTSESTPLLQTYSLLILAIIAILGSYSHERLMRLNWLDMTRLRNTRQALRESERRFEAFMDHSPAIAWIKDQDSRYVYRNKAHRDRYGEPGQDWTGRNDAEFFPESVVGSYADTDRRVLMTGEPVAFETVNRSRDGSVNQWWIEKFPFSDGSGHRFVAGIGVDVAERNRLQKLLRDSESRFQGFLDNTPSIVWMKDDEGRYLYVNRLYKQFLGVEDESWRGRTDRDFFLPQRAAEQRKLDLAVLESGGTSEVQEDIERMEGRQHWVFVRFCFLDDAGRKYIGGVGTDITARKQAEDSVRLQSLTDELTGLYNRRGFSLLVDQQIKYAQRSQLQCALLYVDLDNLKLINQAHGHDGGDLAITSVSEALRVAVRSSDLVARIGGDEFVVLAVDCADVPLLVRRVLDSVDEYNRSELLPFKLSVSVGSSEFKAGLDESIDQRMVEADQALLEIKRARTRPLVVP